MTDGVTEPTRIATAFETTAVVGVVAVAEARLPTVMFAVPAATGVTAQYETKSSLDQVHADAL